MSACPPPPKKQKTLSEMAASSISSISDAISSTTKAIGAKTVQCLSFFKGSQGGISDFKKDLLKSANAIIIIAFGPSRSGKSTLLNYLTVRNFPLLDGRTMTKNAKRMARFKARGGSKPCTQGFQYAVVKASEFMAMHGLGDAPAGFGDFELFFVDSEGFGNIEGASEGLFLGLFSLLGAADAQVSVGLTPASSEDRVRCFAENIVVSRIFGNEPPKAISIIRGGSLEEGSDNESGSGSGSGSGSDSNSNSKGTKHRAEKKNKKLYENFKRQDTKDIGSFASAVKKRAIVDEGKLSILTMPYCNEEEGIAYKKTVRDLAGMILEGANPKSGEALAKKIDECFDKVCMCRDLADKVSMDDVYSVLMKEFIHNAADDEQKKALDELNDAAKKMEPKELADVWKKGVSNNKFLSKYANDAYCALVERIEGIVPSIGGLDEMTQEVLKLSKERINERVCGEGLLLIKLHIDMTTCDGVIARMHDVNPCLHEQKPGCNVTIKLIDEDGNATDRTIRVIVQERTFTYSTNPKDKDVETKTFHYIFPAALKVVRRNYGATTNRRAFGLWSTKTDKPTTTEDVDVTQDYTFNFLTMRATPIASISAYKCEYYYSKERSWLVNSTEEIKDTRLEIRIEYKDDLRLGLCEVEEYTWVNREKGTKTDRTVYANDPFWMEIKAVPHELTWRTNITDLTLIQLV